MKDNKDLEMFKHQYCSYLVSNVIGRIDHKPEHPNTNNKPMQCGLRGK